MKTPGQSCFSEAADGWVKACREAGGAAVAHHTRNTSEGQPKPRTAPFRAPLGASIPVYGKQVGEVGRMR